MRYLLGLFVLTSLGCKPVCSSKNLNAIVPPNEDTHWCREYQGRFDRALNWLQNENNLYIPQADWSKYTITIVDVPSWNYYGVDVSGITFCNKNSSSVGHTSEANSALLHEMVHYAQGCNSGPNDTDGHAHWEQQGIRKMLQDFSVFVDEEP